MVPAQPGCPEKWPSNKCHRHYQLVVGYRAKFGWSLLYSLALHLPSQMELHDFFLHFCGLDYSK